LGDRTAFAGKMRNVAHPGSLPRFHQPARIAAGVQGRTRGLSTGGRRAWAAAGVAIPMARRNAFAARNFTVGPPNDGPEILSSIWGPNSRTGSPKHALLNVVVPASVDTAAIPRKESIVLRGHSASAGGHSAAWPRDYSTTVYLDRHAYWRLAHFQQGCGAAVPRRATSVCHSCLTFLLP
jgi:hypothetical protein